MNHEPNTIQWRVGSIVIHDADAKEPRMLMRIDDFTPGGLAMCRYVDLRHSREVYLNTFRPLHDPSRFGMCAAWAQEGQSRIEAIHAQWDWARRWNYYWGIGVHVRTTSADGGFETVTVSKAAVWNTGAAMVHLARGGWWLLNFVELVTKAEVQNGKSDR